MTVSENIKTVNNKIEQNKAQCNLDRQTVKILALSSANVSKYEFLTGKDVLLEKRNASKSCHNQKFWVCSIRYWVEKTNWHCKKTVSKLDKRR